MIKNHIIYNSFSPWEFEVEKADGAHIWDTKGNHLIDFTSGWNVTNLGWNHPEITEAFIEQAKKNTYASMWTNDPIQDELAKKLTSSLPEKLNAVARATGGTEANEEALKTARVFTGRKKILGFRNTYHGQSLGTLSIANSMDDKKISPLVPEFIQMDYPHIYRNDKSPEELLNDFLTTLEDILKKEDVAAIVTEAGIITGWGSTYVAPKGYLANVRKLTQKYGTLLILDEVGTGFSRCGKLFGMQLEDVVPDIVTFAKGFSNGVAPMGAMVTTTEIVDATYQYTNLTSTFGWIPTACAASLKTLEIHIRDKVWEKSASDGSYFLQQLQKQLKSNPYIGDIRGIGMEIGVDLVVDKAIKKGNTELLEKVVKKARKDGLHLVSDQESNIQIMPPLTIERKDLDKGIDILVETIKACSN